MNRIHGRPLVTKATGGKKGGGACLTPEGEKAVQSFWKIVEEFGEWLKDRKPIT